MDKNFKKEVRSNWLFRFMHNFHYPKITLLIILVFASYLIFRNLLVQSFLSNLQGLSYLGIFLAGMLFAFGFTAPFAVGFFITLNPSNMLLAGILGGLGALFSDFLIFKFIRFTFLDEFYRLEHTKIIKETTYFIENHLGHRISVYLMYVFAGFLIASPLPDEAGVIMLAGVTKINPVIFAILIFILNSIGITLILII